MLSTVSESVKPAEKAVLPAYRIVDADAHFIEPLAMWREYLPEDFRYLVPRYVTTTSGQKCTLIGDFMYLSNLAAHTTPDTPERRLAAMDSEGIHSAVI